MVFGNKGNTSGTGVAFTRNWDDDQGQKHYVTEVIAEEAYFADSRRDGAGDSFENTFGTAVSDSQEFQVSSDDDLPF